MNILVYAFLCTCLILKIFLKQIVKNAWYPWKSSPWLWPLSPGLLKIAADPFEEEVSPQHKILKSFPTWNKRQKPHNNLQAVFTPTTSYAHPDHRVCTWGSLWLQHASSRHPCTWLAPSLPLGLHSEVTSTLLPLILFTFLWLLDVHLTCVKSVLKASQKECDQTMFKCDLVGIIISCS